METETIDKLFLELSQFTKARTEREIALTAAYDAMKTKIDTYGLALMMIMKGASEPVAVATMALGDRAPRTP